jgi:hypothetical protein
MTVRVSFGRRGRRLAIASGVLLAAILAGGFMYVRLQPVHASGTGCGTPDGTPVCSFKGDSAGAQFQTNTDCVSTGANLFAFEDVTRNPPNAGSGVPTVFLGLETINFCDGTSFFASGESTDVSFSVVDPLKSATVIATVPMTDDSDPTHTFIVTVNVTWQGFGTVATQIDNSHFRTGTTIFSSHFKAESRDARATGSITDGTTEFATGPSIFTTIQKTTNGTISLVHP